MSDNLLELAPPAGKAAARPAEIPEKFWDGEAGAVRVEALLKSYRELEKKLSQRFAPPAEDADEEDRLRFRRAMDIPDAPDDYAIEPKHAMCGPDCEINQRLHEAGFTRRQAQLVYDLAAERLLPIVAEAASEYEAERQRARLAVAFGGEERFRRMAGQLAAWGRANLPREVFEALSTTAEGVQALHRMMQDGEPKLAREAAAEPALDEAELRRLMRDPRYWRAREPEFVKRVTEGFRRLVGG
jgi:hypothetical protein